MANDDPTSSGVLSSVERLEQLRAQLVPALQRSNKAGAQTLAQEIGELADAMESGAQTSASHLAALDATRRMEGILEAVRYWTNKDLNTRLRRFWDRLWKNTTPATLNDCCAIIKMTPPDDDHTHSNSVAGPNEQVTPPPPSKAKDILLAGLRIFLEKSSGAADFIPDPAGKAIKAITDTGIKIMDVLDNVDNNVDEARNLGAHIASLVQAILQYVPPPVQQKTDAGPADLKEVGLANALVEFTRTLTDVADGLEELRRQGRFTKLVLAETNKSELDAYNTIIERAFRSLQLRLQVHMLQSVHGVEATNTEQYKQWLLDRLGGADNGAQEKAADEAELLCLPGTRTEILDAIDTWIDDDSSQRVMWLNAVAGCGKTSIAATAFHRQKALFRTAAIFYCTAGNQERCGTVVRSLALWLSRSSYGSLEKSIRDAIRDEPNVASLPLSTQVKLLLEAPLGSIAEDAPPVVIVIDALDEWYDTKKVQALIGLLVKLNPKAKLKIIITSRDEGHIRTSFPAHAMDGAVWDCALDENRWSEFAERDIRKLLEYNFKELHRAGRVPSDWPSPAQLDALVRKSERLFQFAATALRFIKLGYPPDALNAVLNARDTSDLKELDILYLAILQRIFENALRTVTAPILRHVLISLVCSSVPISLDVIAFLLAETPDHAAEYERLRQSALNHLGSFVVVPQDLRLPIRFLHTSIVDFLTDPTRCTDDRFFVHRTQGHAYLAQRCLERLNRDLRQNICGLEDFRCGVDGTDGRWYSKPDPAFDQVVADAICPGLRYASLHWTHHLELVPASPTPVELPPLVQTFTSTHILHWIEILAFLHSVLSVGHPASRKAADWCSRVSSTGLSESIFLLRDTTRIIGHFPNDISSQPLILYEYILSFVPTESMLRKTYEPCHNRPVDVIRGPMQKRWPAHQWAATPGAMVFCVALSPDGLKIASGGYDDRIKLWDAASGMPIGEPLEGHTDWVQSLVFSRDGRFLVSSSKDSTIRIWDVETGRARGDPLTGHTDSVRSVAPSLDGTMVASGSDDGTVRFWALESGREIGEPLELRAGGVNSVAFTPDGSTVVCGCGNGSIRRRKVKTREEVGEAMTGHTKGVLSVCVSSDGKAILSGSADRNIRLWDAETGEQIGASLEGHTGDVRSVAFSPDGETIVSGSDDCTVRLWDARTGKQRRKALTGHTHWVRAVAFTPNGKTVVSVSDDGTVRAWDVDGLEDEREEVERHRDDLLSVAFSSDAGFVATGSVDGSIMVWSAETGTLLGTVNRGYGRGKLQFSADGKALREDGDVHGGWDGVVREWDVSGAVEGTGAEIRQVEPHETLEFPDLGVEGLRINDEGWISRGRRKWLWVPQAYGWLTVCHPLGTTLVLGTRPVPILDVAALL